MGASRIQMADLIVGPNCNGHFDGPAESDFDVETLAIELEQVAFD